MATLEVFDPAMCCSTGVCGPQVDPALARFEADLRWLGGRGAQVIRYNLGQEPGAFAGSDVVRAVLEVGGEDVLPVVLVDGKLRWTGHYPTRDELAATLSVAAPPDIAAAPTIQACCAPAAHAAAGVGDDGCDAPTLQRESATTAATARGCC